MTKTIKHFPLNIKTKTKSKMPAKSNTGVYICMCVCVCVYFIYIYIFMCVCVYIIYISSLSGGNLLCPNFVNFLFFHKSMLLVSPHVGLLFLQIINQSKVLKIA